jgi:hypothetical protein
MEILRVPSHPTQAMVEVSTPSITYSYTIVDVTDHSELEGTVVSNSDSKVIIPLPSKYDGQYIIKIDDTETQVEVVRPYVDPTTKAENASDIEKYKRYEIIVRAIIDSIIEEGFYYRKHIIETSGTGADYLPVWVDAKKVLKLFENNVLMYDSENKEDYHLEYRITDDGSAIELVYDERVNRLESAPLVMSAAASDLLDIKYSYRGFAKTFDYKVLLEVGHVRIPSEIVIAAELLIEDLACGKLEYFQRYISDYNTDQFKIKFDRQVFEGTGNVIVDKILSKYLKSIKSVGVL